MTSQVAEGALHGRGGGPLLILEGTAHFRCSPRAWRWTVQSVQQRIGSVEQDLNQHTDGMPQQVQRISQRMQDVVAAAQQTANRS
ncbi:hypothetical protein CDG81_19685 [Actinopolyspora erythraea]|uniref:Uncharacterized protein n=1 Tax=Actinopolyspora erythraea TaxID=414996 RepID=A0A099D9H1_9ACTN|nr:hypothetical protein CDG81_19685 [Actinopolyspora erythraea]KGI82516.1 hypothetical protein IL38_05205 [Actinopolyspora erythraea]